MRAYQAFKGTLAFLYEGCASSRVLFGHRFPRRAFYLSLLVVLPASLGAYVALDASQAGYVTVNNDFVRAIDPMLLFATSAGILVVYVGGTAGFSWRRPISQPWPRWKILLSASTYALLAVSVSAVYVAVCLDVSLFSSHVPNQYLLGSHLGDLGERSTLASLVGTTQILIRLLLAAEGVRRESVRFSVPVAVLLALEALIGLANSQLRVEDLSLALSVACELAALGLHPPYSFR